MSTTRRQSKKSANASSATGKRATESPSAKTRRGGKSKAAIAAGNNSQPLTRADTKGPRGVILPPPEVLTRVDELLAHLPFKVVGEYRRQMTNRLTMDYYFPGEYVAFRETEHGIDVIAVGLEELGKFCREAPLEVQQQYPVRQADPSYESSTPISDNPFGK